MLQKPLLVIAQIALCLGLQHAQHIDRVLRLGKVPFHLIGPGIHHLAHMLPGRTLKHQHNLRKQKLVHLLLRNRIVLAHVNILLKM